jgi:chemotaxis protein CheY-P-specific phosphatase CheC
MQTRTANLDYLEQVLKVGFDHAARSFSKLLGARVRNGMSPGAYSMDYLPESIPENNDEEVYVLIIQVIGDFSGNSYLIFNKAESLVMIERLKPRSQDQHFQEAVLLEVDHIISAAVIAALARYSITAENDTGGIDKIYSWRLGNIGIVKTSFRADTPRS